MLVRFAYFALGLYSFNAALADDAPTSGNAPVTVAAVSVGNIGASGTSASSAAMNNQAASPSNGFNFKMLEQVSLTLFSNFHGSPLEKLDSSRTPDRFGYSRKSLGVYFDSTASVLGAFTEAKYYGGEIRQNDKTFKVWAMPYVNYELSDDWAFTLGYEMEAKHNKGHALLAFDNVNTDLQPGVRYWVTRKLFINPYVNIYTSQKMTLANTYVGAIISASIL
ncbi:MAG: hypothetical protein EOP09_19605 [Proteobacteria bacterium]|nr:MAG: hypothetical protein EOP09_19605 [Pseudomonadota bacterium]